MRKWSHQREQYARALRAAAAESVIARIRRHRSEAPGSFGPLFAALEGHVFDGDFDVARLCALSGENRVNISKRFGRVVGMTPYGYITSCRLETSWGLLASDLEQWEIAEIVGYRSVQVYTDAFARWYGLRPKAYRDELGALLRSGLVTPGDAPGRSSSADPARAVPPSPPAKLARLRRFFRRGTAEPRYRRRRDLRCTWSGVDAREHPSGGDQRQLEWPVGDN